MSARAKMEPEHVFFGETATDAALCSIAISLRRIADALEHATDAKVLNALVGLELNTRPRRGE